MRLIIIALWLTVTSCTGLTLVECVDTLEGTKEAYMRIVGTDKHILIKYPDAELGGIYKIKINKNKEDEDIE